MSRRGGSGAAALGGPIRMSAPAVRPAPPPAMPAIRVANPSPRVSPAGTSINASANNEGYSLSARQTFGGVNRNVFVEGQVSGAWGQQPSIKIEKNQTHNDALQVVNYAFELPKISMIHDMRMSHSDLLSSINATS